MARSCTWRPSNRDELDEVIDAINATGYGLTFGLHTRIDDRVQHVSERIQAGNIYVNRNQIGAIVGTPTLWRRRTFRHRPQGGRPELPAPVRRQTRARARHRMARANAAGRRCATRIKDANANATERQRDVVLPGPTGESNRLTTLPRAAILCMGPGAEAAATQAARSAIWAASPCAPPAISPPRH